MEVYIEYVILDNFFITLAILIITSKCLHINLSWPRAVLASSFGTFCAILIPLIRIHNILLILLKILSGALICLVIPKKLTVKKYFQIFITFLGVTFFLGGISIATLYMLTQDLPTAFKINYFKEFPIGVIIAVLVLGVFFGVRFFISNYRVKTLRPFLRRLEIFYQDRSISLNGLIDSGNNLYDPDTNLPVVVVNKHTVFNLLSDEAIISLAKGGLKNAKIIDYGTASNTSQMLILKPDKILIYSGDQVNTIYDVMLGIAQNTVGGQTYEALIHPALV
ncbi:MAG TPA: sigma-E processing peptidase SpoIIGA [Clostridia bacterium]|jgi:stage II sporulation protein GA (sporulation sigma-E factor processing peptidase)